MLEGEVTAVENQVKVYLEKIKQVTGGKIQAILIDAEKKEAIALEHVKHVMTRAAEPTPATEVPTTPREVQEPAPSTGNSL